MRRSATPSSASARAATSASPSRASSRAEPPNAIVNQLVILPDIEKRLEAFVRVGHGIVVFPGGAGTAEEILYLRRHPARSRERTSSRFPSCSRARGAARSISSRSTPSWSARSVERVRQCYRIIVGDPDEVAREMLRGMDAVREFRRRASDAYNFNWLLRIPHELQQPFEPTHEAMAALHLRRDAPPHQLAADLRRAFSGIVAGNVKEHGHPPHRAARAVRTARRPRTACSRSTHCSTLVRAPAPHEAVGRIPALLSHRRLIRSPHL